MARMFVNRTGLAVAGVLAIWHAVWAAIVGLGVAQPLVDFVYRIHFVEASAPKVGPFKAAAAAMLVLLAAAAGYAIGAGFALAWNCLAGCVATGAEPRTGGPARAGMTTR